jgi:hypothetical protein
MDEVQKPSNYERVENAVLMVKSKNTKILTGRKAVP